MNGPRSGNKGNRSGQQSAKPADARGVALAVLNEYRQSKTFVATSLDRLSTAAELSPQDRGLAGEMVYGVVRRQATLDAIIQPCVSRPRHRVEPELWTLLQLGTYQLVLLSSIPSHAAVNETVELAARLGKRQWTGMINGVLRAIDRTIENDFTEDAATDAVPLADGRFLKLKQPVFPDPAADFAGYVSQAFSYPGWLINRWTRRFDPQEVQRLAFWFNAPANPFLRVNLLKSDARQTLDVLGEADIEASPGALPESIRLDSRVRVDALKGLKRGYFTIQDESAMCAVDLLDPQPGETVLDLCAAPGTKTTHIAERMQDTGTIIATDVQPDRLKRITGSCHRLGISNVQAMPIERDGSDIPDGPFDAILVDVPCSNSGVLGKRPEVRWRLSSTDFHELPVIQLRLLEAAAKRLKPDGRLVYATCSIEPEENREITAAFIGQNPKFQLIEERNHSPGQPADGGYQALIRRV
jgi:16S rRNA (cytosine967-C5)-methyltransferase